METFRQGFCAPPRPALREARLEPREGGERLVPHDSQVHVTHGASPEANVSSSFSELPH